MTKDASEPSEEAKRLGGYLFIGIVIVFALMVGPLVVKGYMLYLHWLF